MPTHEFVQLLSTNATWSEFEKDWRGQCETLGEDFDSYAEATFSVVRDIIEKEHVKAGVYALKIDGQYVAMCQLNRTLLPKYTGHVLRVRFLTLSPRYDLTDVPAREYGILLATVLGSVVAEARRPDAPSKHIKFHLRSPADQQFFTLLGSGLSQADMFESIATSGAWLYITDK